MRCCLRVALAGVILANLAGVALAQEASGEEAKKKWSNKTEFGLTSTSGNSQTLNYSFSNEYKRFWERAELSIDASALRNEATNISRVPDATETAIIVTETKEVTAESYLLAAKYRRDITERLMWYVYGAWSRILQAGIDDRYRSGAGLGYAFIKSAHHSLIGELGGDYTDETQVSGLSDSYANARAFLGYDYKITEHSELSSDLEGLENLDDTEDWRVNWITSVTSSLSSRVALKLSYTVLYDNQPVVGEVMTTTGSLPYEFEKTDTILTASVVVNF